MTFAEELFSFEGRMGRQDFWVTTLTIWGINIAVGIVLTIVGWGAVIALATQADKFDRTDGAEALRAMAPLFPLLGIWILLQLALIWPQLAICAKRLHDRGQSGLWLLMYVGIHVLPLVPILGILLYFPASFALFVWWLVNLGCLEGTPGPNQYGESLDPRWTEQAFA